MKIGIWRYFLFDLEETLDSQTWRLFSKCFEVSIFLHQTTASAWREGCALFRASTESKFFKTRWKIKFRDSRRYNEINNINRFKRKLNSLYILLSKKNLNFWELRHIDLETIGVVSLRNEAKIWIFIHNNVPDKNDLANYS